MTSVFAPLKRCGPGVLLLQCLNLAFWVYFWADVSPRTVSYEGFPTTIPFEYEGQAAVWFGYALPNEAVSARSIRAMETIQFPTLALAIRSTNPIVNAVTNGMLSPIYYYKGETVLGTDVPGWIYLITMVLSFGQWYVVAKLPGSLVTAVRSPSRTSPTTRFAFSAVFGLLALAALVLLALFIAAVANPYDEDLGLQILRVMLVPACGGLALFWFTMARVTWEGPKGASYGSMMRRAAVLVVLLGVFLSALGILDGAGVWELMPIVAALVGSGIWIAASRSGPA